MCGIVGAIGLSKNPAVSHELLTSLLSKTESRGDDATGFWATMQKKEGDIVTNDVFFSKEPKKSTSFVRENDIWKSWKGENIDLMISHCRRRTNLNGTEANNINNHPFISKACDIALIHNGNIPEIEMLKGQYDVKSDCDSEILLRLFQSGFHYDDPYIKSTLGDLRLDGARKLKEMSEEEPIPDWCPRWMGIRDLFARVNHGAMAVAVAEIWNNNTRALWLFRNKERPLHIVDAREELGQIFFVSTPELWREGLSHSSAKDIIKTEKDVIILPELGVWLLTYTPEEDISVRKWKIVQKRKHDTTFEKERPAKLTSELHAPVIQLHTNIDLSTFHVIKPPKPVEEAMIKTVEETTELTLRENVLDGSLIAITSATLTPKTVNTYKDEKEALNSFSSGQAWLYESQQVTVNSFMPGTEILLKYWHAMPAVVYIVPEKLTQKKNQSFRVKPHFQSDDCPIADNLPFC